MKASRGLTRAGNLIFALGMPLGHVWGYAGPALSFLARPGASLALLRSPAPALMACFAVFTSVRSLWSGDPAAGSALAVGYATAWLLPFMLGALAAGPAGAVRAFGMYCAASGAVIVVSLFAYAGVVPGHFGEFILVEDGLLKALRHHIGLGGVCLMITVLAGSLALSPALGRMPRRWFGAAALICAAALLLTGSRGYYVAAAGVVPVFAVWKAASSSRPARWFTILAGLVFLILGAGALLPVVRARVSSALSGGDQNVSERLELYRIAAAEIRARPVTGFGPGTAIRPEFFTDARAISFAHPDGRPRHRHFHDFYLTIGAEMGLPGLGLFCAMVYYMFSGLIRSYRGGDALTRAFSSGAAFALAGVLIGELFDAQLRGPGLAMDLFWICGLAAAVDGPGPTGTDAVQRCTAPVADQTLSRG